MMISWMRLCIAPPAAWVRVVTALQDLALLAARLYVAQAFLASGLTKLRDWDTTLLLFANEYQVPVLDPVLAAWMGTAGELVLPVLLTLGLLTRLGAVGLSVVNVVAVASLPGVAEAAWQLHLFWGSLLVGVALWGGGRLALDEWLRQRG